MKNLKIFLFCIIIFLSINFYANLYSDTDSNQNLLMVDPAIDKDEPFCYLSKPSTCLTVIAAQSGTQVTFDGALYTGGLELCFFYGTHLKPITVRQKKLYEGWIPIVTYSWKEDTTEYSVEAFANTLDGNPLSNLINFVRIEISNNGDKEQKINFAAATRFNGRDHRFERMKPFKFSPDWVYEMQNDALIRDNKLILIYPEDALKEAVPGVPYTKPFAGRDMFVTERAEVGMLRFELTLQPKQKKEIFFKFPYLPVDTADKEQIDSIRKAEYKEFKDKTISYWKDELSKGAELIIPEDKVAEAHKANLMYTWQAIWNRNGKWIQGVNKFQYKGFWLRDGAYIIHANDVWGHHEIARKTLEVYPEYQDKEGLFSSYKGQLDGFGQGLYALGQHAIITGDIEYAKQIYKHFPPAVNWLTKARASDNVNIMPFTEVTDNEYIKGRYTGHNFWALLGVRTAARIAKLTGNDQDAETFLKEYDDFKKAFYKKLEEVAGKDGYIPPGLDVEGGQDWGNLIGVYPTEVLEPSDARLKTTLDKVHKEKYQEGIMTYMGRLHQYVTVKATQNHVMRDEQEQALRDFYSILLHTGSTHEMFEWQAVPWGDRDVDGNYPPHGWGAAMFNLLLRNMLIYESGGNGGLEPRDIHLFSVISPEWAKEGNLIGIKNARTEHGIISFLAKITKEGAEIDLEPQFRTQPKSIIIHIPYFAKLISFKGNIDAVNSDNSKLVFTPDVKHISLKWETKEVEPLSCKKFVDDYKQEYEKRFKEYIASGKKPAAVEAPHLYSLEERMREFNTLYGKKALGIAVGKPVKSSTPPESGHPPENAFDGDASDADLSSWWSGPPAPKWVQVDLEEIVEIGGLHAFPYWDGSRYYQYKIEVSADEKNWTEVVDMSTNTMPAKPAGDYFKITPIKARFVRITMLYNSANPSVHLVELKVFKAAKDDK